MHSLTAMGKIQHSHRERAYRVHQQVAEFQVHGTNAAQRLNSMLESAFMQQPTIPQNPLQLQMVVADQRREPIHLAIGNESQPEWNPIPRDAEEVPMSPRLAVCQRC